MPTSAFSASVGALRPPYFSYFWPFFLVWYFQSPRTSWRLQLRLQAPLLMVRERSLTLTWHARMVLAPARSLKSITATPLSCSASSKAQQRCKEVYNLQSLVHDCKWSSQRCLLSHCAAVVPEPGKCTEALKCASGSYIVRYRDTNLSRF